MGSARSVSSRQRVAAALRHEVTDRVPLCTWWTPEAQAKLAEYFGVETEQQLIDTLGVDVVWLWMGPYKGRIPEAPQQDMDITYWGFATKSVPYDGGVYEEFCYYPLADAKTVEQVDAYAWPDPDAFDYDEFPRRIAAADAGGEKWITIGESSFFERSWAMVGFERFLEWLLARRDLVMRIMENVCDFYIAQTLRTLRACGGRADMVHTADDVGSQQGMLISPDTWRETLKPLQKKFNDAIRSEFPDVVIHYHSCGSIVPIIDELMEIGVDVLNPIQPKAVGMEPSVLAERWGDRLCFCGGVDIQELMPRGTPEQVRNACEELIRTLGRGGGFILSPAHALQVDVPVENVLAMVEAVRRTPPVA